MLKDKMDDMVKTIVALLVLCAFTAVPFALLYIAVLVIRAAWG